MSLDNISSSIKKDYLFLFGILIIYLSSLIQMTECSNTNQIGALISEVKKFKFFKLFSKSYNKTYSSVD